MYIECSDRYLLKMCMQRNILWILTISFMIHVAHAANILGIFPTDTKSHYILYSNLMHGLARRGHNVTVVTQHPGKNIVQNMNEIRLDGLRPMPMIPIDELIEMTEFDNLKSITQECVDTCKEALVHPVIQDIVKRNDFDLFVSEIFGSDCFMSIGHKLGIPMVGVASSVVSPWVDDMSGSPDNPSYIVPYFLSMTQKMTFFQRVYNAIMYIVIKTTYATDSIWPSQKIVDEVFENVPPLGDLCKNYSIILTNSHFSFSQIRPWVPQVIEIAGLHIPKKIEKLPPDLQTFLDDSKNGFIYFCLGSLVPTESIKPDTLQTFIEVFSSLKQNVLWKINSTEIKNLPPNIKIFTWMPQLEILCHPNIRLFISHGGMMGMQESIYCGVPMLGIPMFADQGLNLALAKEKGIAKILKYHDIRKKTLLENINDMLDNKSYLDNVKHISKLFKDRPLHPMDTAIYWVEYVLRNNGALNLRSPSLDLTWYQYLLLDVLVFILVIVFAIVYLFWLCIKSISKKLGNIKSIVLKSNKKEN